MEAIVFLLGSTYVVMSSLYILYTRETVNAFRNFFDRYELRFLAIIPALVGLLFLVSANSTRHPWVFRVIAVIAFSEAVLAIVNPKDIFNQMLNWFFGGVSDRIIKLFGILGIILGTLFISWIK